MAGWDVLNLGQSLPTAALLGFVDSVKPEVIGFSAALLPHAAAVKGTVSRMRAEFGASCPTVMVGGAVLGDVPDLWRATGADVFAADARGVLEIVA